MAHVSEPRLVVLHGLRLKGLSGLDRLANHVGMDQVTVASLLASLEAGGLVAQRQGRLAGWTLTPAGRAIHPRLLSEELEVARCRHVVESCYRRFLPVNQEVLAACTDWQVRTFQTGELPNDHSDPGYDGSVLERLRFADAEAQPLCAELSAHLERFSAYGTRLARALRWIEGDGAWFTSPAVDSYHAAWFELHEDLLATLGRARAAEGAEEGAL